jgi:thioredoxin-like negative regulator of GroEL
MAEFHLANALNYAEPEDSVEEVTQILARIRSYFEQSGELGSVWMVDSVHAEKLMNSGMFIAAAEIFRDIIERAIKLDDDYTVRTARASLAEALFLAGETTEARQVLGLIDSSEWGENNVELQKLERVTALMLETLANTLDIDFPDVNTSRNRRA